jgi:hypothetical protein
MRAGVFDESNQRAAQETPTSSNGYSLASPEARLGIHATDHPTT